MSPITSAPSSWVDTSATPRVFRPPAGTQAHDGLVLCDTAAYRKRYRTKRSQHFSNFGGNNHKRRPAELVTMVYGHVDRVYQPSDFPAPRLRVEPARASIEHTVPKEWRLERARRYLAALPPAIAGGHGDLHTFRVCCRLVRGFALDDSEALELLREWNTRCLPPWTDREIEQKIASARRYGREPIGGLLEAKR